MKIISLNINGLKAFYGRSGNDGELLDRLIIKYDPDIILLQETKCDDEHVEYWLSEWSDKWNIHPCCNSYKKGYAGVASMIRKELDPNIYNVDFLKNNEYSSGRVQLIEFKEYTIVNVYVLNSGSEKEDLREEWDKEFHEFIRKLSDKSKFIIIGDLNSCTDEKDCHAFAQYFDNYPGCYAFEIDALNEFKKDFLVDAFREIHKDEIKYSWFSYRGSARYNNQGWRIDYALVDNRLKDRIKDCDILGSPTEYSDHCPVYLEIQ